MMASDVETMGELAEWLAERGLKMKPRCGRGTPTVHIVELRKAGQPHVARAIVTGNGPDWGTAVVNAMFKYESRSGGAPLRDTKAGNG